MNDNDTDDNPAPHFARTNGLPGWMGPSDDELKMKCPLSVGADFRRLANSLGMSASALLLELAMNRLYGREQLLRMHERRLELVAGIDPENAVRVSR